MGLSNVVAAALGGVPVCHGSGGVTAHYRLGARSGGAPLMLGIGFLVLGLFGSNTVTGSLTLIPLPALGVLLSYVGFQHASLAKDLRGWREWTPAIAVAMVTLLTRNLAFGFAAGAVTHFALIIGINLRRRILLRKALD